MKYRHFIFLVTWTEHACQVSNYFLPEISLRPGKWLKHLPSVLKIVVTTDILITESFSIHFYSFSLAFSSQDAATINLFMFVFLTTCRPINLCSDFCCWSWLLLPVPVVAPKGAVVLLFKTDSPINYHHLRKPWYCSFSSGKCFRILLWAQHGSG